MKYKVKDILNQCKVDENNSDFHIVLEGYTKEDYHFNIHKDDEDSDWYIIVTAPCGMCDYDGWWLDSSDKTLEEAVNQALFGSLLIEVTP